VDGGDGADLGESEQSGGATWLASGDIIVAPRLDAGLVRYRAELRRFEPFSQLDRSGGELSHRFPAVTRDGNYIVFYVRATQPGRSGLWIAPVDDPDTRRRLTGSDGQAIVAGDLLLYANDGALVAQRLDPERGVLVGGPVVLSGAVGIGPLQQLLATAATQGPLVYGEPGVALRELVWSDRAGRAVGTLAGPVTAWDVRIAPNGRRVAVAQLDPQLATLDVWTYDGTVPVPRRLSPALDVDEGPVWAPDAARLAWTSARTTLVLRGAEGTLPEERVHRFTQPVRAWDWSPDGRALIVGLRDDATREDLWMVDLRRPQAPTVCVRSPFNDTFAAVSRDGRWLAYASDESGRFEIYVDTFPVSGARAQVTLGGGAAPRWRQDGQEIVFQRGHALYAVSIAMKSSRPVPSDTFKLFDASPELRAWDMTPDGQRFLLNVPAKSATAPTLHVVTNWYVHALRQTEAARSAEAGRGRREPER
jgi:hypothetical protein